MLHAAGKIEDINYSIYLNWYDYFIAHMGGNAAPSHHFIYVATAPETCDERIRRRNRSGESGIPLDYLRECEKYHVAMVADLNLPCITLDGNIHKEDGDPWDTELAHIATFIDGTDAAAAPALAPALTIGDRLRALDKTYHGDNDHSYSEEEYIALLCKTIDDTLSPNVEQLYHNCEQNIEDSYYMTSNYTQSDFETVFVYVQDRNDVYAMNISVCINNAKYPIYDKYTATAVTYPEMPTLLAAAERIEHALCAHCTARGLNYKYDSNKYIAVTF